MCETAIVKVRQMESSKVTKLRQAIVENAQIVISADICKLEQSDFHNARYNLFAIGSRKYSQNVVKQLAQDGEIIRLSRRVFSISCRAGVEEERAIARSLLEYDQLKFEGVYNSYFGAIYEVLMRDELEWFASVGLMLTEQRIAYIGGGAMPLPALLMARRTGCSVTIIDPDEESCNLARILVARLGLADRIDVRQQKGEEASYERFTMAWIANWIESKQPIFSRLHQYPSVGFVVARSAAENSLSFIINDAVDCQNICEGFKLRHTTARRKNLSLVSIILENTPCVLANTGRPLLKGPAAPVVDSMTALIGNTPMLRLDPAKTGLKNIQLFAKLEHLNPFGSIKDRTALGMLGPHIEDIAREGKDVIELSSGNAARGLQAIASMHGVAMETISNRIRIPEMRKALQIQGAKITPLPDVDPHDAYAALHFVDERARRESSRHFYTDQYRNTANAGTHHSNTGREILDQVGPVDYFIGAVGTAGSTIGISTALRRDNSQLDVTGVVSEKDDFIPGIRHKDEIFNVGPFREDAYQRLVAVSAADAIEGLLSLIRDFGVMAGPSSGSALIASLAHLRSVDNTLSSPKTAVFIVCDRMELYLSYIEERRPDLFT